MTFNITLAQPVTIVLKSELPPELVAKLNQLLTNQVKIMTDLTDLTREVSETKTVQESAVALLQGLKAKLDAAGTDPVALKALSDSLNDSTESLAAAVSENTPAEE